VTKGVEGVKDVNNQIEVVFKEQRPDSELEKEIKARLANDVRVDDYLIKVNVEDGEAMLSGTVGSLAEKNRAIRDSWVSGVDLVNPEDLSIEWWARDEMRRESVYQKRPDQEVENAVKDAFLYDPRGNSSEPEVESDNGTVTLKGTVSNLKAKRAAEEDAKNVFGVWRVKNRLKVQPSSIPTDLELKEHVEEALISDPYVDRDDITIDVSYGRVYLLGKVNNSFEEFHAERVVERVGGVIAVINRLEHEYEWKWRTDWEIRDNVKEQLTWSLFVDASDINVTVEDGIVTLEGEVNNWSEYNAAEENAFEGGAKDVRNKLTVLHPYYGPYNQYPFWTHPLYK
jgi:osmotically-inducible protein OsmY